MQQASQHEALSCHWRKKLLEQQRFSHAAFTRLVSVLSCADDFEGCWVLGGAAVAAGLLKISKSRLGGCISSHLGVSIMNEYQF